MTALALGDPQVWIVLGLTLLVVLVGAGYLIRDIVRDYHDDQIAQLTPFRRDTTPPPYDWQQECPELTDGDAA